MSYSLHYFTEALLSQGINNSTVSCMLSDILSQHTPYLMVIYCLGLHTMAKYAAEKHNTLRTVSTDNWCRTNKTLTLEQVGANS